MSNPEDRLRRLLRAYPAWYRSERGEEILSTLRESAQARGGRVSLGEAGSLLAHGLAVRFDLSERGTLGELAGRLASPGLALAALLATVALVFGELLAPSYMGGPAHPGPFLTVGPIAYAAWIAAFVVDIATSSRFGRVATWMALAATAATVVVGDLVMAGRPPLFFLATLVAFAIPALVRPDATRAVLRPKAIGAAGGIGVAVLGATAVATAAGGSGPVAGGAWSALSGFSFYQLWMATLAGWTPVIAIVAGAAGGVVALAGRRQTGAALVLAVVPWLVVATIHASRSVDQLVGGVALVVIAVMLISVGYFHQTRIARQVRA